MDEKISKINEKIMGLVTYIENFAKALEKLVPIASEKKEIELTDGQIYRLIKFNLHEVYYLLQQDYQTWSLLNLESRNTYWISNHSYHDMQKVIQKDFILCPDVYIRVFCPPPALKTGGAL